MRYLLICLFTAIAFNMHAQNYIGLHRDSLAVLIKTYDNNFKVDNSSVNKVYKYLKYIDPVNEQTWLFFLDENNLCTYHKLMSDYLNYEETTKKFNEKYKSVGDKIWEFKADNKIFNVKLTEDEWYFTVVTKEKTE